MTSKPGLKIPRANRVWDVHGQFTKVVCIIAPNECYTGYRNFQLKKSYSDRCPYLVYSRNTLLLIIYLSAVQIHICHGETEFNRVYFLRFYTNNDASKIFKILY